MTATSIQNLISGSGISLASLAGGQVWPFPANWAAGVTEEIEYMTDVWEAFSGREQRSSLRNIPRRRLTVLHNLTHEKLPAYDALLRKRQNKPFLVPQWHLSQLTTTNISIGDNSVSVKDGFGTLVGQGDHVAITDGYRFESLQVSGVSGNTITFSSVITASWPAGVRIYPAYDGLVNDETSSNRLTSSVAQAQVTFLMLPQFDKRKLPDLPAELTFTVGNDTREVVIRKPNWVSEPTAASGWDTESVIYDDGPIEIDLSKDQGYRSVKAQWSLLSDDAINSYLGMVNRLRGRRVACWLPSWTQDFTITREFSNPRIIYVQRNAHTELATTDDPTVGISIHMWDGQVVPARVISISNDGDEAALTLDRDLPVGALRLANVTHMSLMYRVRQAADTTTITWHTSGVAEVEASFITVQDDGDFLSGGEGVERRCHCEPSEGVQIFPFIIRGFYPPTTFKFGQTVIEPGEYDQPFPEGEIVYPGYFLQSNGRVELQGATYIMIRPANSSDTITVQNTSPGTANIEYVGDYNDFAEVGVLDSAVPPLQPGDRVYLTSYQVDVGLEDYDPINAVMKFQASTSGYQRELEMRAGSVKNIAWLTPDQPKMVRTTTNIGPQTMNPDLYSNGTPLGGAETAGGGVFANVIDTDLVLGNLKSLARVLEQNPTREEYTYAAVGTVEIGLPDFYDNEAEDYPAFGTVYEGNFYHTSIFKLYNAVTESIGPPPWYVEIGTNGSPEYRTAEFPYYNGDPDKPTWIEGGDGIVPIPDIWEMYSGFGREDVLANGALVRTCDMPLHAISAQEYVYDTAMSYVGVRAYYYDTPSRQGPSGVLELYAKMIRFSSSYRIFWGDGTIMLDGGPENYP